MSPPLFMQSETFSDINTFPDVRPSDEYVAVDSLGDFLGGDFKDAYCYDNIKNASMISSNSRSLEWMKQDLDDINEFYEAGDMTNFKSQVAQKSIYDFCRHKGCYASNDGIVLLEYCRENVDIYYTDKNLSRFWAKCSENSAGKAPVWNHMNFLSARLGAKGSIGEFDLDMRNLEITGDCEIHFVKEMCQVYGENDGLYNYTSDCAQEFRDNRDVYKQFELERTNANSKSDPWKSEYCIDFGLYGNVTDTLIREMLSSTDNNSTSNATDDDPFSTVSQEAIENYIDVVSKNLGDYSVLYNNTDVKLPLLCFKNVSRISNVRTSDLPSPNYLNLIETHFYEEVIKKRMVATGLEPGDKIPSAYFDYSVWANSSKGRRMTDPEHYFQKFDPSNENILIGRYDLPPMETSINGEVVKTAFGTLCYDALTPSGVNPLTGDTNKCFLMCTIQVSCTSDECESLRLTPETAGRRLQRYLVAEDTPQNSQFVGYIQNLPVSPSSSLRDMESLYNAVREGDGEVTDGIVVPINGEGSPRQTLPPGTPEALRKIAVQKKEAVAMA